MAKPLLLHFCYTLVWLGLLCYAPSKFAANESAVAWSLPDSQWQSFITPHFRFSFLDTHLLQAERAAVLAEQAWDKITRQLNWIPQDRIEVVLVDDFDFSNGYASPLPYNHMRLLLSPPDSGGTLQNYDDWLNLLITHELTHVVHLDMAGSTPAVVREVLGRNILTFPHLFTPGFMIEGLAVYLETSHSGGYGRGQSTSYDMQMRLEVLDGIDDLAQAALPLRDWPFGKQYLYGYFYYQFLVESYGEQSITRYLNIYARNILPYFLQNSDAAAIFGKDHEALWLDFKQWLSARFKAQIDLIRELPLVAGKAVSNDGLSLVPSTANSEFYYYLQSNGKDRKSIIRMDSSGHQAAVLAVPNMIDLDVDESNDIVFSRYLNRADGRGWADLFMVADGEEKRLTVDQRYRNVRWANRGKELVAKRIGAGFSQLDLLDADGTLKRMLWRGTLDEVVGDFDVSNDGNFIIASIKRAQQGWNLGLFDLQSNRWKSVTSTRAIESGVRFSQDDKSIFYSADYGATFNLYSLELATGLVKQLSHVMGGAMLPVELGDQIIYQNYGAAGYNHYRLPGANTLQAFNITEQQDSYDYADRFEPEIERSQIADYQPWSTLRPREWFPLVEHTSEYNNIGFSTAGSDALDRHSYLATLYRDTSNDLTAGELVYFFDNKWQLQTARSYDYRVTPTADLNLRREDFTELARINLLNAWENQLKLSLGIVSSQQQDLRTQPFSPLPGKTSSGLIGARLDFSNVEIYRLSNSPSWGSRWSLLWESNDFLASDFSGDVVNVEFSRFFDLPGNHVAALHSSAGYGFDRPEPFFLGGESSALGQPLFGRDSWYLRGYGAGVQSGTRIQTNSLEYRMPLASIERNWDLFPLGLGNASLNFFIDHGAAWRARTRARYLSALGIELDIELVLGYGLSLPVNLGLAYGLDPSSGGERSYLRIGYTF